MLYAGLSRPDMQWEYADRGVLVLIPVYRDGIYKEKSEVVDNIYADWIFDFRLYYLIKLYKYSTVQWKCNSAIGYKCVFLGSRYFD